VVDAQSSRTKIAYDMVADGYARTLPDTSFEASLDRAIVDYFLERLHGSAVLDAGCGTGRMMAYMTSRQPSVSLSGVDLSAEMVRVAREAHPAVRIVEGDLSRLPFDAGEFDGVLAWYSIIHLPPRQLVDVFAEAHRVLRSGGLLLVGFQSGRGVRDIRRAYGHDIDLRAYLHSPSRVRAELLRASFSIDTELVRGPRQDEKHSQSFLLARA